MNDLMLDIETLGVGPDAAIVSIAVVQFDLMTGEVGDIFRQTIKIDTIPSCRTVDLHTVGFWMEQPDDARHISFGQPDKVAHATAMAMCVDWIEEHSYADTTLWGKGPTFDIALLTSSMKAEGITLPIPFRNHRDVRTILDIGERMQIADDIIFAGVPHDPVSDCRHQIKQIHNVMRHLTNMETIPEEELLTTYEKWR